MLDYLIKLIEEEEDILNQEIYEQFPFLKEQYEVFQSEAKQFCLKQTDDKLENGQGKQETDNLNLADTAQPMISSNYSQAENSNEEGLIGHLTQVTLDQFSELKNEKINLKEGSHFFGLDDSVIDLDQLRMEDGKIKYKNKQDLKIVTFLISGYTTQETKASKNFAKLANSKNIESQTNLFIFYKWSDSSIFKILKEFLQNVMNDYQAENYKECLKNLLNNWLKEWNCSKILKKIVYWMIKVLTLCIKLAKITNYFLRKIIEMFETMLDTILKDLQEQYGLAKQGGTALAEYINNQNLLGDLSKDFMGHSLGTVVTAYALQSLVKPARYVILMGGAATVSEIEDSQQKFQMVYNFYSTKDYVIKIFLNLAHVIGDQAFIGSQPFSLNENFFNENTKIDHLDYMNKYQEFYDTAMKAFEDLSEKKRIEEEEEEKVKKASRRSASTSTSTPDKQNYLKIGGAILGIAGGSLLLYLFLKHSKKVRN
ncbi:hypothetical protein ABPG74_003108 [Tetrahymena malaccensis]